jgi:hypothetical protein
MGRAWRAVLGTESLASRFWVGIIGRGRRSGRLILGVIDEGGRMAGFRPMLGTGLRLLSRCLRMVVWIRSLAGRRRSRWGLHCVAKVSSGGGILLCLERARWWEQELCTGRVLVGENMIRRYMIYDTRQGKGKENKLESHEIRNTGPSSVGTRVVEISLFESSNMHLRVGYLSLRCTDNNEKP